MSQEVTYPDGPLPPRDKLKESVGKLFQEVGASNLTRRVLTKRLSAEYKIDFTPHRKMLDELVMEKIQEPELKKEVAKAAVAHKEGPSRGTKQTSKRSKAEKGEKGEKGKKTKREKEEGEPSRPKSAYFIFTDDCRPALMEEARKDGGKVNVAEIGKKLGSMWAEATPEVKAKYEKLAEAAKKKYDDEKAAWLAAGGGKGKGAAKGKKEKKEKKEGEPKRPMNATFLYMNENREAYKQAHPEAKLGEIAKALSDQYKNLSETEKKVWEDQAVAAKARYEREKAEFDSKN